MNNTRKITDFNPREVLVLGLKNLFRMTTQSVVLDFSPFWRLCPISRTLPTVSTRRSQTSGVIPGNQARLASGGRKHF